MLYVCVAAMIRRRSTAPTVVVKRDPDIVEPKVFSGFRRRKLALISSLLSPALLSGVCLVCPARTDAALKSASVRKANPFAKDSISSGPSGLKAAAHKAFDRVTTKPAPTPDAASPTGSITQSAFAKFRAMVRKQSSP